MFHLRRLFNEDSSYSLIDAAHLTRMVLEESKIWIPNLESKILGFHKGASQIPFFYD